MLMRDTKEENMRSTLSAESIWIVGESNWIQMLSLARMIRDGSLPNTAVAW